jgi:putative transposase
MEHSSEKHRRSIRLKNYDYSQSGAYFVTICTYNKECLFGGIADGKMILSELGEIARDEWNRTAHIRDNVELDEYVVMPNHLHGIIVILRKCRGVSRYAPTNRFRSPSQTIGSVIRGYKSSVTKRINESRMTPALSVWQRNYWEHVIRNEQELSKAREYIVNNPLKWTLDRENPANIRK